jgi:phage/plasmid-associated DNA primase
MYVLGDYAVATPTETFMKKTGEQLTNDIARLRGARFVTTSETEQGKRLSEHLIKQVTGNAMLQWMVGRKTENKRLSRALKAVRQWRRENRHRQRGNNIKNSAPNCGGTMDITGYPLIIQALGYTTSR